MHQPAVALSLLPSTLYHPVQYVCVWRWQCLALRSLEMHAVPSDSPLGLSSPTARFEAAALPAALLHGCVGNRKRARACGLLYSRDMNDCLHSPVSPSAIDWRGQQRVWRTLEQRKRTWAAQVCLVTVARECEDQRERQQIREDEQKLEPLMAAETACSGAACLSVAIWK